MLVKELDPLLKAEGPEFFFFLKIIREVEQNLLVTQ